MSQIPVSGQYARKAIPEAKHRRHGASYRGVLAGLDPNQIIIVDDSDEQEDEERDQPRTRHTTRQALNGRAPALYDQRYHPMDDYTGRGNRSRGQKIERKTKFEDLSESEDSDNPALSETNESAEDEKTDYKVYEESDHEPVRQSGRIKKIQSTQIRRPIYDMNRHPQDSAMGIKRKSRETTKARARRGLPSKSTSRKKPRRESDASESKSTKAVPEVVEVSSSDSSEAESNDDEPNVSHPHYSQDLSNEPEMQTLNTRDVAPNVDIDEDIREFITKDFSGTALDISSESSRPDFDIAISPRDIDQDEDAGNYASTTDQQTVKEPSPEKSALLKCANSGRIAAQTEPMASSPSSSPTVSQQNGVPSQDNGKFRPTTNYANIENETLAGPDLAAEAMDKGVDQVIQFTQKSVTTTKYTTEIVSFEVNQQSQVPASSAPSVGQLKYVQSASRRPMSNVSSTAQGKSNLPTQASQISGPQSSKEAHMSSNLVKSTDQQENDTALYTRTEVTNSSTLSQAVDPITLYSHPWAEEKAQEKPTISPAFTSHPPGLEMSHVGMASSTYVPPSTGFTPINTPTEPPLITEYQKEQLTYYNATHKSFLSAGVNGELDSDNAAVSSVLPEDM